MRAARPGVVALSLVTYGRTLMTQQPTSDVDCSAARGNQAEIDRCAAMEADRAKNSLNDLLVALKVKLSSSQWKELQAVQDEWSRFADDLCKWEVSFPEVGPIAPAIDSLCQRTLTRQRIDVIKTFLWEGEGMPGP